MSGKCVSCFERVVKDHGLCVSQLSHRFSKIADLMWVHPAHPDTWLRQTLDYRYFITTSGFANDCDICLLFQMALEFFNLLDMLRKVVNCCCKSS
jgi:hypothetical protein